jgi:hypothetical protein
VRAGLVRETRRAIVEMQLTTKGRLMDAAAWIFVRELIGVLHRRDLLTQEGVDALVANVEHVAEDPETPPELATQIRQGLAEFDETLIPKRPRPSA